MSGSSTKWVDTTMAIAIGTALVYTAGWSYAYHWFDLFDIGLIGLGIPKEYHFVYGFWVTKQLWWALVLAVGLALLCLLVLRRFDRIAWARRLWTLATLAAFSLIYLGGASVARDDYGVHRKAGFEQYSVVRVWLKDNSVVADSKLEKLTGDLAEGKYRLLIETTRGLYLIKPTIQSEPATVEIPWSEVRAMRRLATNRTRS